MSPGCSCCRKRDTDELNTLSSGEHKEPSGLDHKPISVISQDHRHNPRTGSKRGARSADTAKNPPEYDDLPQFNWKAKDLQKRRLNTDWDSERANDTAEASPRYKEDDQHDLPEFNWKAKDLQKRRLNTSWDTERANGTAEAPSKSRYKEDGQDDFPEFNWKAKDLQKSRLNTDWDSERANDTAEASPRYKEDDQHDLPEFNWKAKDLQKRRLNTSWDTERANGTAEAPSKSRYKEDGQDDFPEFNWKAKDLQKSRLNTDWDSARTNGTAEATSKPRYKEDGHRNLSKFGSRAKKKERTDYASGLLGASGANPTGRDETPDRAGCDERPFAPMELTPMEHEYRRYDFEPSSQDDKVNEVWDNGRTRSKERWEARPLSGHTKRSRAQRLLSAGQDNVAFNKESTETTV